MSSTAMVVSLDDENIAQRPGVRIEVSMQHPTGRGARDPMVLLRDAPLTLDGQALSAFLQYRENTFDTYDGHNQAQEPDWYAIRFPEVVSINCIEMTMECPNRDGGWWTSLSVEYQVDGQWKPVTHLAITPPYNFEDVPYNRRPYETHALTFDAVTTDAVRLIGRPGGLAQFTSLSYVAVYRRDLSRWTPASIPAPPVPYIFKLIPPGTIWDLSESLAKLTNLSISVAYMDHYLDRERYLRWWNRLSHKLSGGT
jgi:hypothetical protein